MTIHSINHVQLAFPLGRETAIRYFYASLLGLTELPHTTGSTQRYVAGSHRIDLAPTEQWAEGSALAHLAFEVHDLPRLRERLLAQNIVLDESRPLPGHLRFYVRDPVGNQLEFLQPDPAQGVPHEQSRP
ncbi:VOC family protein [Polaromonas sp.]|uniref:VOC family protein n=1 Tax=Polaromonas sp. TaxID=1869339 RepID=UPI002FC5940C